MKKENKKSLWDLLNEVEDPRRKEGRRYELSSILKLLVSGFLCGCNHVSEVLRWGNRLTKKHRQELGFKDRLPCQGALSNLFKIMDVDQLESLLHVKMDQEIKEKRKLTHIAMDGKTLKGSGYNEVAAVHVLTLFSTSCKKAIKQKKQPKGSNEITTAIELLKEMNLKGLVISGDAIFAQKKYSPSDL